jgi:HPt (histidine-containing phosphotransfer) domain-containing protein
MTEYDIEAVAEELMFTTSELQEIFEIYFDEAVHLLPDCYAVLERQDYMEFSKIMHGFKGASANLRMKKLAQLAEELEKRGKAGGGAEMALELPLLEKEIDVVRDCIEAFYGKF